MALIMLGLLPSTAALPPYPASAVSAAVPKRKVPLTPPAPPGRIRPSRDSRRRVTRRRPNMGEAPQRVVPIRLTGPYGRRRRNLTARRCMAATSPVRYGTADPRTSREHAHVLPCLPAEHTGTGPGGDRPARGRGRGAPRSGEPLLHR